MPRNRKRSAKDIGSKSPASGSAKEQSMHGASGGPQGEKPAGVGKQPAQTSGRRSARHEHLPEARKGFSPEEDPSLQGDGKRSPDSIRRSSGMQGLGGRNQASGTKSDDVQELADRE